METTPENNTVQVEQTDDDDTIDLGEIFYLLGHHIVQIILFALLGAVITFAVTEFLIAPKYTATSKMYILSSSTDSAIDLSDLQMSSQLKDDYKELLTSRSILEDVESDLNLNYTIDQLHDMIEITNPTDTRILNIAVTSENPKEAADIANSLAKNGKEYLPQIMKTQEPSVFESAEVPKEKSSPTVKKDSLIGGLVLALIYVIVLIAKNLMNDAIVTPDDVSKVLGFQPLAVVPEGRHMSGRHSRKQKEEDEDLYE